MSVLNENQKMGASGAGGDYEIEQSLRFNDDDGSYLSFQPASASNRKTYTFSFWCKRATQTNESPIFTSNQNHEPGFNIMLGGHLADDFELNVYDYTSGSANIHLRTTQKFRDSSAWYHIVVAVDTTQGTAANRAKIYVNGNQVTSFATETYPSQNLDTNMNNPAQTSGKTWSIGSATERAEYMDGYLAEFNFIDGQALTPDSFGETGDYGEWLPSRYAGAYGTNGFYLPFEQDYSVEGFSTVTYEGTSAAQYIGGTGFSPDMTWFKVRSTTGNHQLYDTVRGASSRLVPNATTAKSTTSNGFAGWQADGFSLDGGGGGGDANTNGRQYIAWNWDMGGTTASNTSGSITSSVRANTAYGQSIVSYTGTGSNATVGHGLASAPTMIIIKKLNVATSWMVYHTAVGNNRFLYLDNNNGQTGTSAEYWNNTTPSSSVISLGNYHRNNSSSEPYIAYCFSDVTGYSKFSSYSGNGSTTGPTVTLGFSPAFVMIKRSNAAEHWKMYDNVRNPFNPVNTQVNANEADAEATSVNNNLNFTATGFQCTSTNGATNASGSSYIYMAFADTREYAYWYDQSGNNNDWESEGGLTESDVMVDSPTNNFATLNPLDHATGNAGTLSDGNLKFTNDGNDVVRGTLGATSGKWYAEYRYGSNPTTSPIMIGLMGLNGTVAHSGMDRAVYMYTDNGGNTNLYVIENGSGTNTSVSGLTGIGTNTVLQLAWDVDSGKVWVGKDNTWLNSGNPSGNATPTATMGTSSNNAITIGFDHAGGAYNAMVNTGSDSSFAGNKTPQGNQDANGIGDFYYAPPTGFLALCTKNLPDATVIPSENFNTVLYTGNDSTNVITGVGFKSDFSWWKKRNAATDHALIDSVRGVTKHLVSNTTNAEVTANVGTELVSFDSDGFTLGAAAQTNSINGTSASIVAWNWKAGGATPSKTYAVTVVSDNGNKYRFDGFGTSAVTINLQEGGTYKFDQSHSSNSGHPFRFGTTLNAYNYSTGVTTSGTPGNAGAYTQITLAANAPALYYSCSSHSGMGGAVNTNATFGSSDFSGSIISTVSANVDAGISIATFTLPTTVTTIGHGLSKPPELIFQKGRVSGSAWWAFAKPVGNTKALRLDTTTNAVTSSNFWNNTDPTSSVVTIGANSGGNNSWLMYCFHSVDGYSKVGSYIGNGNADGPFVSCGFKPAFVLIKRSNAAQDWYLWDTKRSPINAVAATLSPNSSGAEGDRSSLPTDVLSNGFKIRNTSIGWNGNGDTYIFYAIAESPFKNSNAH